jgi:hypothetical protein
MQQFVSFFVFYLPILFYIICKYARFRSVSGLRNIVVVAWLDFFQESFLLI